MLYVIILQYQKFFLTLIYILYIQDRNPISPSSSTSAAVSLLYLDEFHFPDTLHLLRCCLTFWVQLTSWVFCFIAVSKRSNTSFSVVYIVKSSKFGLILHWRIVQFLKAGHSQTIYMDMRNEFGVSFSCQLLWKKSEMSFNVLNLLLCGLCFTFLIALLNLKKTLCSLFSLDAASHQMTVDSNTLHQQTGPKHRQHQQIQTATHGATTPIFFATIASHVKQVCWTM